MEYDTKLARARFICNFIFSILRQRLKYEECLPANFGKAQTIYIGDNDLLESLNDILCFTEQNKFDPFKYLEKFFCFFFDLEANNFSSFNLSTIKFLFRTYLTNNKDGLPITTKEMNYHMLPGNQITERHIFECIRDFPDNDPIQLFNFNVNNDIMLSYHNSKKMFNFFINTEGQVNKKQRHLEEAKELETLILNQK